MINKALQILFIGMLIFTIGCAKKKDKSKSKSKAKSIEKIIEQISVFPRFSADALRTAVGGKTIGTTTNLEFQAPATTTNTQLQLDAIEELNDAITPLAVTGLGSAYSTDNLELNCDPFDKNAVSVKDNVEKLSTKLTCMINRVFNNLDLIFLNGAVKQTTGTTTAEFLNVSTYTYTVANGVSTFVLTPKAANTGTQLQMKIVWNKADKKALINVLVPKHGSVLHALYTMSAYQDANGGVDFLVESKVYDVPVKGSTTTPVATSQQRDSLYLAYDTTSKIFAINNYSIAVDSATAVADEGGTNAQTFAKDKVNLADGSYSIMLIGNITDKVAAGKVFDIQNTATATGAAAATDVVKVFCGATFASDIVVSAPADTCKAAATVAKVTTNIAPYNTSKKLTLDYLKNDTAFLANQAATTSGTLNDTIGKYLTIFTTTASPALDTIYAAISAP